MELELIEKKEMPLLARTDITFRIKHPNERTPKRNDVRDELASQMNVKKVCIIIDNMKAVFGKSETKGFAKIYSSEKDAIAIERNHILARNKIVTAEAKKSEGKKEKTEK
jgi:small subunit ribosomal protein S24e